MRSNKSNCSSTLQSVELKPVTDIKKFTNAFVTIKK